MFKNLEIANLSIGDKLINLGEVLEISEYEDYYSLVIARRGQRQVWTFGKEEEVYVS
ncbi:hypothetical protein [Pedobacter gandavensis]|nr:hypothetical protein [Pedobacter gandavensis]